MFLREKQGYGEAVTWRALRPERSVGLLEACSPDQHIQSPPLDLQALSLPLLLLGHSSSHASLCLLHLQNQGGSSSL